MSINGISNANIVMNGAAGMQSVKGFTFARFEPIGNKKISENLQKKYEYLNEKFQEFGSRLTSNRDGVYVVKEVDRALLLDRLMSPSDPLHFSKTEADDVIDLVMYLNGLNQESGIPVAHDTMEQAVMSLRTGEGNVKLVTNQEVQAKKDEPHCMHLTIPKNGARPNEYKNFLDALTKVENPETLSTNVENPPPEEIDNRRLRRTRSEGDIRDRESINAAPPHNFDKENLQGIKQKANSMPNLSENELQRAFQDREKRDAYKAVLEFDTQLSDRDLSSLFRTRPSWLNKVGGVDWVGKIEALSKEIIELANRELLQENGGEPWRKLLHKVAEKVNVNNSDNAIHLITSTRQLKTWSEKIARIAEEASKNQQGNNQLKQDTKTIIDWLNNCGNPAGHPTTLVKKIKQQGENNFLNIPNTFFNLAATVMTKRCWSSTSSQAGQHQYKIQKLAALQQNQNERAILCLADYLETQVGFFNNGDEKGLLNTILDMTEDFAKQEDSAFADIARVFLLAKNHTFIGFANANEATNALRRFFEHEKIKTPQKMAMIRLLNPLDNQKVDMVTRLVGQGQSYQADTNKQATAEHIAKLVNEIIPSLRAEFNVSNNVMMVSAINKFQEQLGNF